MAASVTLEYAPMITNYPIIHFATLAGHTVGTTWAVFYSKAGTISVTVSPSVRCAGDATFAVISCVLWCNTRFVAVDPAVNMSRVPGWASATSAQVSVIALLVTEVRSRCFEGRSPWTPTALLINVSVLNAGLACENQLIAPTQTDPILVVHTATVCLIHHFIQC